MSTNDRYNSREIMLRWDRRDTEKNNRLALGYIGPIGSLMEYLGRVIRENHENAKLVDLLPSSS